MKLLFLLLQNLQKVKIRVEKLQKVKQIIKMLQKKVKKNKYFFKRLKYKLKSDRYIFRKFVRANMRRFITNAKLLKYPFKLKVYRYISQKGKKFPETIK